MKKISLALIIGISSITGITSKAFEPKPLIISTYISDDREVSNFNGVAAAGPVDVVLTIGNTESCRLEGDAEALSTIVTEVKGNVLVIRPQTSITSWSRKYEGKKITAYVTARNISSLTVSGSGSLVCNSPINGSKLSTTLSGSGSIKAQAEVSELSAVISGSGSILLSGETDHATVVMSSSGRFAGKSFDASTLSATISGSGQVVMKVDKSIKAVISGSGSVNYSGNATVDKTVFGSGGVRKI